MSNGESSVSSKIFQQNNKMSFIYISFTKVKCQKVISAPTSPFRISCFITDINSCWGSASIATVFPPWMLNADWINDAKKTKKKQKTFNFHWCRASLRVNEQWAGLEAGILHDDWTNRLLKSGVKLQPAVWGFSSDLFYSFSIFGKLKIYIRIERKGTKEIICHPLVDGKPCSTSSIYKE